MNSITMLRPRWSQPPWSSAELNGVSSAGTAGEISTRPDTRAGMNPPIAIADSSPNRIASTDTAVVTTAIHAVALFGRDIATRVR